MPLFHYKARDKFGALFEGTIETVNRELVATQLDGLGYIPVSITEEREGIFSPEFLQQFTRITPTGPDHLQQAARNINQRRPAFYCKL